MADISKKTEKDVEKLKDLVKLKSLETEKKISDLELNVGKLESKFKEVWETIPDVKERTEEIEALMNVVQLGLLDFKKNMDNLDVRFKKVENVPTEVEANLSGTNKKLHSLENNIKNLSENLDGLLHLKDEIGKDIEERILPEIKTVKEVSDKYKQQIDEIKKDVDNFSTLVKSFQRTLELTDIDREIKRFEAINTKILVLETRLEELKLRIPNVAISEKELDIMKNRVHELSEIVLDREYLLKEMESAIKTMKSKPPEIVKNLEKIDELEKKFEIFSDEIKLLKSRFKRGSEFEVDKSIDLSGIENSLSGLAERVEHLNKRVNALEVTPVGRSEIPEIGYNELELLNTVRGLEEKFENLNRKFMVLKSEADLTLRRTEKLQQGIKEHTIEESEEHKELKDLDKMIKDIKTAVPQTVEMPDKFYTDIMMKINMLNSRLDELERKFQVRTDKPFILE